MGRNRLQVLHSGPGTVARPVRHGYSRAALFALAFYSSCIPALHLEATSCYSDLGIVRDVDPHHLAGEARRVIRRLEELGAPLDSWELDSLELSIEAPNSPLSVSAIQQVLDAHCLISLSVSSEGEMKAVLGPATAYVPTAGRGVFLVKVDNLGRHASALRVTSPNVPGEGEGPPMDRWMRLRLWHGGAALSGERADYFLLEVESEERGRREALFVFSTDLRPPQQPNPLSYNRVSVLFSLMTEPEIARAQLAHRLRHEHGRPSFATGARRGPPLASIREARCLACHETDPGIRKTPAQIEREESCVACHRELAAAKAAGSVPSAAAGSANTAAPGAAASNRCPVCGAENCRMGCVARTRTSGGEEAVVMAGVPRWLFLGGVGAVLAVSFAAVELLDRGTRRTKRSRRWNVLSLSLLGRCARSRWSKPLLQVPVFALFGLIVYAGLAGDPVVNVAPTLTWTIWWAGLIFLILFFGKAWCFVCPWDLAATIAQGLGRLRGSSRPFTLGLRWPRALKNIYLATGFFVLLTWLELGYGVTSSPRATAWLGLLMAALAVVPALIFDRRPFCRNACLVGRISGLYALFSPVEVRATDRDVCSSCRTRECYRGDACTPGCPTSLYLPAVTESTYCTLCGYCVRSCPEGNVAWNVRPFAADLMSFTRPRRDEALLAVILLALTSFHGLTMTPMWDSAEGLSVTGWIRSVLGVGQLAAFTAGMAAVIAAPIGFYWLLCVVTRRLAGDPSVATSRIFLFFAYSLLPVALFYHLAHNGMHFFMEAQYIVPLLSDPLGRGWDLFGTSATRPGPLLSGEALWLLQVALVLVGHIFGIVIAHYAARRLYSEPRKATLSLIPMLAGMVLYSWISLWILHLDMRMRSTLM